MFDELYRYNEIFTLNSNLKQITHMYYLPSEVRTYYRIFYIDKLYIA